MEVNNSIRTGYTPQKRSERKSKSAGEENFSAKISQVLAQEEEKNVSEENPLLTTEDMMRFIRERKQEIYDKVRKGETEVKIRIGACEYTEKEWDKLMESFDEPEEALIEKLLVDRDKNKEIL